MVYSITYRRPAHVSSASSSTLDSDGKPNSISSGSTGIPAGIPDALSFDRIIAGGTCPPCTTRDFMNYLLYIERAAENLQFFLWFRDYSKRFDETPASERALAPEWTAEQAAAAADLAQNLASARKTKLSPEAAAMLKGTDFAPVPKVPTADSRANPFNTPPETPGDEKADELTLSDGKSYTTNEKSMSGSRVPIAQKAAEAFDSAELKWQPFTVQPFREEINRIITTYLAEGSPRELNMSSRERTAVLHALANTTHPSAFRAIAATAEWSLRYQAHPNFIRWTICNGNRPRVIFARGLGVATILLGFIGAVVITLSNAGRAWRVLAALGWVIGVATLVAAWKGMCVVLHGMHHRHLRPWELFAEDDSASVDYEMKKASFDTVGTTNSYEDEPWVAKYEKRNVIRKVFDREVWIQEPALRSIQDTIFLQAIGGGLFVGAVFSAVFVALPKGGFY
ncbi:MAG: hypothetical protein M1825_002400 [Sarcosagium campestre]|nr:MAG: hypothetical protein M1825_002400 [Sarcosagium campestre]